MLAGPFIHSRLAPIVRALPRFRGKSRIGRALSKALIGNSTAAVIDTPMRDGSTMRLDVRSRTEAAAFWSGEFEPQYIQFLKAVTPPGGTLLDVGANVGLVSVPLGLHLRKSGGAVVAFEPVRSNFERLTQSIALNDLHGTVRAFNVALGDQEGQIEISMESAGGASTGNAVISTAVSGSAVSEFVSTTARIARLDGFAPTNGINRADVVKLDVEGAEVLFLRGAMDFIERHRPLILGEFHARHIKYFGHTFLDATALLTPLGYRIFKFAPDGRLVEIHQPQVGMGDAVFAPDDVSAEKLRELGAFA